MVSGSTRKMLCSVFQLCNFQAMVWSSKPSRFLGHPVMRRIPLHFCKQSLRPASFQHDLAIVALIMQKILYFMCCSLLDCLPFRQKFGCSLSLFLKGFIMNKWKEHGLCNLDLPLVIAMGLNWLLRDHGGARVPWYFWIGKHLY